MQPSPRCSNDKPKVPKMVILVPLTLAFDSSTASCLLTAFDRRQYVPSYIYTVAQNGHTFCIPIFEIISLSESG